MLLIAPLAGTSWTGSGRSSSTPTSTTPPGQLENKHRRLSTLHLHAPSSTTRSAVPSLDYLLVGFWCRQMLGPLMEGMALKTGSQRTELKTGVAKTQRENVNAKARMESEWDRRLSVEEYSRSCTRRMRRCSIKKIVLQYRTKTKEREGRGKGSPKLRRNSCSE
jgi:hypothetical protein